MASCNKVVRRYYHTKIKEPIMLLRNKYKFQNYFDIVHGIGRNKISRECLAREHVHYKLIDHKVY